MQVRAVAYHTTEWDALVEAGWVTGCVDWWLDRPFGQFIETATMIKLDRREGAIRSRVPAEIKQ
jgi:hypothetical protein